MTGDDLNAVMNAADAARQLFLSFVASGFSEEQALALVAHLMRNPQ